MGSQAHTSIIGRHLAAARELLQITQAQLAEAARVHEDTVRNFEAGIHRPRPSTVKALREALEARGIEFYNGAEPGVRLRPSKAVISVDM
jgi:transcriptional regulator with XRE-family HTH domain